MHKSDPNLIKPSTNMLKDWGWVIKNGTLACRTRINGPSYPWIG